MIDAFKIRYLSYFLHEIWVSIILIPLFLLFNLSWYYPAHKFYDCRFQWCQVLLPLPNRSIHSALCSLVVPSVAYTLCVVSSVVHPETSPTCADALRILCADGQTTSFRPWLQRSGHRCTPPPRQTACGSPSESPCRRAPDISGTQFDRPGFQKMIAEVKADRISVVIIW